MKIKKEYLSKSEVLAGLKAGDEILLRDGTPCTEIKAIKSGIIENPNPGLFIITQVVGTDILKAYLTKEDLAVLNSFAG